MKTTVARLTMVFVNLTFICLIFTLQSSTRIDPKTIVGMWLFDEGNGDTAKDFSRNGNDGKLMGSPKWVSGKFGKALEFNGVNDGVEISTPDNFNFLTWTYVLWFRSTMAGWPNLVGRQFPNTWGWTINLGGEDGTFRIRIDTDGGINQVKRVGGNVKDDQWHHGAAVLDEKKKSVSLYVDAVNKLETTYVGNFKTGGGFLRIAAPAVGATSLAGSIDDVGIFNQALAVDDIADIMKHGLEEALGLTAISPLGKLSTTWASIKAQ